MYVALGPRWPGNSQRESGRLARIDSREKPPIFIITCDRFARVASNLRFAILSPPNCDPADQLQGVSRALRARVSRRRGVSPRVEYHPKTGLSDGVFHGVKGSGDTPWDTPSDTPVFGGHSQGHSLEDSGRETPCSWSAGSQPPRRDSQKMGFSSGTLPKESFKAIF